MKIGSINIRTIIKTLRKSNELGKYFLILAPRYNKGGEISHLNERRKCTLFTSIITRDKKESDFCFKKKMKKQVKAFKEINYRIDILKLEVNIEKILNIV